MNSRVIVFLIVCLGFAIPVLADPNIVIVSEKYPNLASGALTFAKLAQLSDGVLLKSGQIQIVAEDVNKFIDSADQQVRQDLQKNKFFVLEQLATEKLLLEAAKKNGDPNQKGDDSEMINSFLKKFTADVNVSETDVRRFYKENEAVFCGTPLEKVRKQIEPYVLQEKQQQLVNQLITNFGKDKKIVLSLDWVSRQAELAKDNVLDKSRLSGKATLAVFSAASCCGPDKAKPILESLQKKFSQKANILYIEARQQQILAARYKVQAIPTQLIFDKSGKEVFRHSGFYSQPELEKQLEKAGLEL